MLSKVFPMHLVLLILLGLVSGSNDASPSGVEITIIGPPALKWNYKSTFGKISAMPALFGIPVYNGEFIGVLKTYQENMDACESFPENYFQSDLLDESSKNIALIQRGSCSFVAKVRNCEKAGAKGVVVYDHIGFGDLPIMVGDATRNSISIPSILIGNEDGLRLNSYVNNGLVQDVEIEISWSLPRSDETVEWEFWTSSDVLLREKSFFLDFKDVVQALGAKQIFKPHYIINEGVTEASEKDCSNDLRYCSFSVNGVSGKQFLTEWLTQICVWRIGQNMNDTLLWWDYIEMFNMQCAGDHHKWDGKCSTTVLNDLTDTENRIKLVNSIKECVSDSGGLESQSNTIFEEEIESYSNYEVLLTPAVTINKDVYYGKLLCPNPGNAATCSVFAAICASFAPESTPLACLDYNDIGCPPGEYRDASGVCHGDGIFWSMSQTKSITTGNVIIIILLVTVVCGIGLLFIRRYYKAEEYRKVLNIIEI